MAQINRYDGTHITNNVTSLVESVLDVAAKKRSLDTSERNVASQNQTQRDIAILRTNTDKDIALARNRNDKDIAYLKANVERELKNMGFNYDMFLEILRHQNLKNRMGWEEELQEKLESFKQPLVLDRIDREYQNNLKLANFNADEALRRTIMSELGGIISSSTVLTGAEKAAIFTALSQASDRLFNSGLGLRNLNDYGIGLINPDKTLYNPKGGLNNEENKPGWEMRGEIRKAQPHKVPSWKKGQSSTWKGRSQGLSNGNDGSKIY